MRALYACLSVSLFFSLFCACDGKTGAVISAHEMLARMSLEEKIGQLCCVAAVVDTKVLNKEFVVRESYIMDADYVSWLITEYHVGGIIFLGAGYIDKQIELTNHFQLLSTVPLLIAQDFEWGLSMRLLDGMRFPRAMTLGALQDPSLVYDLGSAIGRQALVAGVHIVLAPVMDINSNPDNPIIGSRSFGDTSEQVIPKALAYAQGLQDAGVIACAKHFPGHGDTATDSHCALPVILHDQQRIAQIELQPFIHAMHAGVGAVMTAHIAVPALTGTYNPVSMERSAVYDFIRGQQHFDGLIITDGLGMRGVTDCYEPGELEVAALMAGNDILLCPVDVPRAIACIKEAVLDGRISQQELDEHVMRVLRAKERLLCMHPESFAPVYDQSVFNTPADRELKRTLYRQAVTLVKDDRNVLPVTQNEEHCSIAYTIIGSPVCDVFSSHLDAYSAVRYGIEELLSCDQSTLPVLQSLSERSSMIVGVFGAHQHKKSMYGLDMHHVQLIRELKAQGVPVVVCLFGSPYSLSVLRDCADTIILAYEDDGDAQEAAFDVLIESLVPTGRIPVH